MVKTCTRGHGSREECAEFVYRVASLKQLPGQGIERWDLALTSACNLGLCGCCSVVFGKCGCKCHE